MVPQASPCTVRAAKGPSLLPPCSSSCDPESCLLPLPQATPAQSEGDLGAQTLANHGGPAPPGPRVHRETALSSRAHPLSASGGSPLPSPGGAPCGGHPPRPGFATCRHTCSHAGLIPMRTDPSARAFLRSPPSQFMLTPCPGLSALSLGFCSVASPSCPSLLGPPRCHRFLPSCRPPDPQQLPPSWEAPPFMILGSWEETVSERLRRDPVLPVLCPPLPLHPSPPPPALASLCKAEAWKFPST